MTYVTIGELVVDWLAEKTGQNPLEPGSYYRSPGGNSSNVAVGLARLGSYVRLLGKWGEDVDGRFLRDVLSSEGVDVSFVVSDDQHHTAQCFCFTGADGEHYFHNWPSTNAAQSLTPDDIQDRALAGCDFLHATGISFIAEPRRSAVMKTIDLAVSAGMVVSFDAGFSGGSQAQADAIEAYLPKAHMIKFNYPELCYWSGGQSGSACDLARRLFEKYKPVVLIATLGAEGSVLMTERGGLTCQPLSVKSCDGIGAGDAYMAGLLHILGEQLGSKVSPGTLSELKDEHWLAAGRFANACGAAATTALGAMTGLPRKPEVEALIGLPALKN